jgi:hypothetical protein
MKISKAILLSLMIFTGCHNIEHKIFTLSIYNRPVSMIWETNNYADYCYKKGETEIRIFNGIIEPPIVESLYNRGMDVLSLSKECDVDSISLTYNDLANISPDILKNYLENYNIISANIYDTKNTKYQFKKFIKRKINEKNILFTSAIINLSQPTSANYTKGYRIENPIYELNRILRENANFRIVLLNRYQDTILDSKQEYKFLRYFISKLDIKPNIIILDISKEVNIDGVYILKSDTQTISLYKKLSIFNKIKKNQIIAKERKNNFTNTQEIIKKTKDYFSRKIANSPKNLDERETVIYIAKSIKKRIKSDFAAVCNKAFKNNIKKGDIRIKDVYLLVKDHNERLVYMKIRGEKMSEFLLELFKVSTAVYGDKPIGENELKNLKFANYKIYKILINENCIKDNKEILNYVTEFSITDVKVLDTIMWYLRNYGIKNENN